MRPLRCPAVVARTHRRPHGLGQRQQHHERALLGAAHGPEHRRRRARGLHHRWPWEHSMQNATPGESAGWLVGVGGDRPVPIPKSDPDGQRIGYWRADEVVQRNAISDTATPGPSQEHLSALHEAHLQSLAKQAGLGYRRLASPEALTSALLDAALAQRKPVRTDVHWLPAALALLLMIWHFLPALPRSPWRGLQRKQR